MVDAHGLNPWLGSGHPYGVARDRLHGVDGVFGVVYACALRGVVDHIDEAGEVSLVDGGREGVATNADLAGNVGNKHRTDGAVGGLCLGFD